MNKIFKLSNAVILAVVIMAVKCGEKEIPRPDSLDPITVTMEQALNSDTVLDITVRIDSVFFVDPPGTQFNNTGSNAGGTRVIKNCDGLSLDVFTSTDREFAYQEIATGLGPIYGIISEYQGNRQLLLRSIEDVAEMTGEKCAEKVEVITVEEFNSLKYEGQLVKIENVQFVLDDSNYGNGLFNGTTSNANGSKTFTDCDGNTAIVFTSTASTLTNVEVPTKKGYLIGEASSFNSTAQLLLRSEEDFASMTEERCTVEGGGGGANEPCGVVPTVTFVSKDFDDLSITSGGWTTQVVVGTTNWQTDEFSGDKFAKITNYASGANTAAEAWLISPAVDLSTAQTPLISFTNLANFNGDPLQLLISTDYSGTGDPNNATWIDLTSQATWDTDLGSWGDFLCSTDVDISSYKSDSTYVAFKYTGTNSNGSTWEIDDILIKE